MITWECTDRYHGAELGRITKKYNWIHPIFHLWRVFCCIDISDENPDFGEVSLWAIKNISTTTFHKVESLLQGTLLSNYTLCISAKQQTYLWRYRRSSSWETQIWIESQAEQNFTFYRFENQIFREGLLGTSFWKEEGYQFGQSLMWRLESRKWNT